MTTGNKRVVGAMLALVVGSIAFLVAIFVRSPDPGVLLLDAAERGDLAAVKTLVQQGVPINYTCSVKFGWTPLIGAIFHYQTNVVQYLVESGADVNLPDKNGVTPLMWAIGWGDEALPMVNYLIEHGANVNAKDKRGMTAFDYARADPPTPALIKALEAASEKQEKPRR